MSKRIDLTGREIGNWKVISFSGVSKQGCAEWLCECRCGKRKIVSGHAMRSGKIKSCGCLNIERTKEANTKHGMKGTRLYRIWQGMRQRTKNPNNHEYSDYGGRGIELYKDWEKFENFCKWAKENGYAENLTIDRKDNEKGYSPDNCRWVTAKANNRNKRNNHCLAYKGETKTIAEWAEITGLSKAMIRYRITKMGWSAERALETPKMRTGKQL